MRILLLSNIPPQSVGGAEMQALFLARRWAETGNKVTIAGHSNIGRSDNNISILHIPTIRKTRLLRAVSYLLSTAWLLWKQRHNYDVIYCRFLKEQAFAASLAKIIFRLKQPVIACPECAAIDGDIQYLLASPFKTIWIKVLNAGLTTVNIISRQIEAEIKGLELKKISLSRIPNGVSLPVLTPIHKKTDGITPLNGVFVGRLVEQKGVDVLLKAAHLLKLTGHLFSIKIIGDGPLRSTLEETSRSYGISDCIEFKGLLSQNEVAIQLEEADLFVLPSRFEGLPVALLEALAYSLPAIATKVSGSEEIIDSSIGWLINTNDPQELATALLLAIKMGRPELQKMGEKAREKAEREYDIKSVAHRYERLFHDLLNTDSSTSAER